MIGKRSALVNKVRCINGKEITEYITAKGRKHYCNSKETWIPRRKLERSRKCNKFGERR